MNPENLPKSEQEQYNPDLDAQDEEVASGGNNKLMYVLVALVVALVIGYIALPKGGGGGLSSVTPTFMLDDAAVTATAPTSADSIAAGLKAAAPVAKEEETDVVKTPTKTVAVVKPAAAPVAPGAAPVTIAAPAPAAEAEPVPAAAPAPVAAPEPVAPANVTMSGRIEDENGRPMVGATVLLRGTSKGTSTDANGNYTLEVPGGNDHTLIYGYGGYEDEIVRSSGSKAVNVTLTPRAKVGRKRR